MYERFFGLKKAPFKLSSDLELFFEYGDRNQVVDALVYSIQRGDPIVKVIGDVGCGKTTILRKVLKLISNPKFHIIHIYFPNISTKDLLFLLCKELDIPVDEHAEKYQVIELIEQKLLQLNLEGHRVLLMIDEAQAMPVDTLEELRMLSNLETDTDKLLQIVFFGQPEFDKTLHIPQLRQLQSRVSYEIYLKPLDCHEVWHYLNYRMQRVGYAGEPVFSKHIACKIQKLTGGLPREINLLADKLLMSAFNHHDKVIKNKHLKEVTPGGKIHFNYFAVTGVLILVIGGAAYFSVDKFDLLSQEQQLAAKDEPIKSVSPTSNQQKAKKPIAEKAPVKPVKVAKETEKPPQPKEVKKSKQDENKQKSETQLVIKEKKSVAPKNTKLEIFAQVLGLTLDQAKPIFKLKQQTNRKVKQMMKYQYTIQLMVGPIDALDETYQRTQKLLPKRYKDFLIPLIDIENKRFILVLSYSDDVSKLKSIIHHLPRELNKSGPYVMTMSKYQKIYQQSEQALSKY